MRPVRRERIPRRHLAQFCLQMQMLLSSGVLLGDALARLGAIYPDRRMRRVLGEVHRELAEARTPLSRALARFPRCFPPAVALAVRAGEEGGALQLAERFGDLADRLDYEERSRRLLRRACAYPCFVLVLALGFGAFLLGVVMPRLSDLLASMGGGLPPLARGVLAAAALARARWPELLGAPVLAAGAALALRRAPACALAMDRAFLRVPMAGPAYRDLAVAAVCRVFRSLYRAGHPAPQIVDLCAPLVGNRAFRRGLAGARHRIAAEGATLAEAFGRSGLFPPLACMAIEVGERSGRLPQALERVSDHFREEGRRRLDALAAVAHPALVLLMVGGVGVVLLAFFQAFYQAAYASAP